jgi:hypothetical protein
VSYRLAQPSRLGFQSHGWRWRCSARALNALHVVGVNLASSASTRVEEQRRNLEGKFIPRLENMAPTPSQPSPIPMSLRPELWTLEHIYILLCDDFCTTIIAPLPSSLVGYRVTFEAIEIYQALQNLPHALPLIFF